MGLKLVAVVDSGDHPLAVGGHFGHVVSGRRSLACFGNSRGAQVAVPHSLGYASIVGHLAPDFSEAPLRIGQGGLGVDDDIGPLRGASCGILASSSSTIGHSRKSTVPLAPVVNWVLEAVYLRIRLSSTCDHIGPSHFLLPSMIDDARLSESGTHLPITS
ncbi:MAG: hypothetical protein WA858_03335, partial [Xanthobacteraceae bacterium]